MTSLAAVLADEGHYPEAEKLDRDAIEINRRALGAEHPNTALATYNLACVLAHLGRRAEALSLLREAVDHGLSSPADLGMDKDPDLKSLQGDPRFAALVAHAKEKAAAAQRPQ
jgi:tetratricopeptide (TPR) repeat protein